MKRILCFVLVLTMVFSLNVSMNMFSASAAAGDGTLDFDTGTAPEFTVSGQGTASELYRYVEDNYTVQGRVSHPAHSWAVEENALGKKGYSIIGKGEKNIEVSETQTDPCLIAFVDFSKGDLLTSTDQYYTFEFDMATSGPNNFELLATTDDGSTIVLMNTSTTEHKTIKSDALYISDNMYTAYAGSWHNYKFVIKSADVTSKEGEVSDAVAENNHQYWIYANGNLIKSGTTAIKKRNSASTLNSFAGIKSVQMRAYGVSDSKTNTTTGDWTIRLDNIKSSVSDSLPETKWDGALTFDTLTDSTDLTAINKELWAEEIGHFLAGSAGDYTYIRDTKKALGSVEGGVYGKEETDKAISLSMDGNQTDGTHFLQIVQSGYNMNQMQRMGEGDFYEFQTYMAWEADSSNIGVQGFYSNTVSNDGKGPMLLNVGAASGSVTVLGNAIPGINLSAKTWYKFNIVIHSGNNEAENDEDKNWFNLYINDKLVAQKVVFVPTLRNNVKSNTFLGVDKYWLQVGIGAPNSCGKVYYDDVKIKYSEAEGSYTPVFVETTDDVAKKYIGTTGHMPGFDSYIDDRASYDAEKWGVTDGTIAFVPSESKTFARIIREDGTKIFDTFEKETKQILAKTFAVDSVANQEFNYAVKDFTTYSFSGGAAGRAEQDYSFKLESSGVYDNWVMTKDAEGNPTSSEYQTNPENWINQADAEAKVGGGTEYKFRDSYNPFVQLYKGSHIASLDFTLPWSVNLSVLADGKYNTVDFQIVSDDTESRVTKNLFTLNKSNGYIYVDKNNTGVAYGENQWLNFVVNVYPATNEITLWYNGEVIYDGVIDFPWNRMARIKIQHAICNGGHTKEQALDCKLMADDIIFSQGASFVPTAIDAVADSEEFDGSNISADYIVANENTTVEQIASGIKGGSVAVYDSKNYSVASGDAKKGNIVVVSSEDGLMYKYIYVADPSESINAEIAFTQSYMIGYNTFAPKYYTDNILDYNIVISAYKNVDGTDTLLNCNMGTFANAEYEYNGSKLVATPKNRIEFEVPSDAESVKMFLIENLTSVRPVAAPSYAKLKSE